MKIKLFVTPYCAGNPNSKVKHWMGCCSGSRVTNIFKIYINSKRNIFFQIIILLHELGHYFNDEITHNYVVKGKLCLILHRITIPIYYPEIKDGIFPN